MTTPQEARQPDGATELPPPACLPCARNQASSRAEPFRRVHLAFLRACALVVELYLRSRRTGVAPAVRWSASGAMLASAALLAVGTYYFTRYYWGPGIVGASPSG